MEIKTRVGLKNPHENFGLVGIEINMLKAAFGGQPCFPPPGSHTSSRAVAQSSIQRGATEPSPPCSQLKVASWISAKNEVWSLAYSKAVFYFPFCTVSFPALK